MILVFMWFMPLGPAGLALNGQWDSELNIETPIEDYTCVM